MCRYGMRNLSSPRSQKPTASRMAIVASTVLPIIGVFPFQDRGGYWVFPCASRVPGAGGKPESNGGPPEARLGCRGKKVGGTGCGRRGDEGLCEKKELARGGWAGDARRSPAT